MTQLNELFRLGPMVPLLAIGVALFVSAPICQYLFTRYSSKEKKVGNITTVHLRGIL
jgi:hypothetical protein